MVKMTGNDMDSCSAVRHVEWFLGTLADNGYVSFCDCRSRHT
jgi:hypothetical protein